MKKNNKKKIKNFPKILDSILLFLAENYSTAKTVKEISNEVYKKDINRKSNYLENTPEKNLENIGEIVFSYSDHIKFALDFLEREKLIGYKEIEKEIYVYITSKGFSKIGVEGFEKENRKNKINLWLQRASWFCSILSIILVTLNFLLSKNLISEPSIEIIQIFISWQD